MIGMENEIQSYYGRRTNASNVYALGNKTEKKEKDEKQNINYSSDLSRQDMIEILQKKMDEMYEKIKRGEIEESYPIGAASYTIKEWKQLLKAFDAIEDSFRKQIREGIEKRKKKEEKKKEEESQFLDKIQMWNILMKLNKKNEPEDEKLKEGTAVRLLLAETIVCTHPVAEGEEQEIRHITYYAKDGIYCRKEKETEYEWIIKYENEKQYDLVMEHVRKIKEQKEDLTSVSNKEYWEEILQSASIKK